MRTIVITGSTRGLGLAMAQNFLKSGCAVTVSGRSTESVQRAVAQCQAFSDAVLGVQCDVRHVDELENLWNVAREQFGQVDIWINNAGINQPYRQMWEIAANEVQDVIQTNLMGAMFGSQVAMKGMIEQGFGQIFNMEGFGSNDMQQTGLNVYGTSKRALTHFTKALAKEASESPVLVGLLSPGMMVTDFITQSESMKSDDGRTRKIFNILGDKPETVAHFLVPKMLSNKRNGAHFQWLTNVKAAGRFAKSMVVKRDLFS